MLDTNLAIHVKKAPAGWAEQSTQTECSLHQISPYIGKLKSRIAGDLVEEYSRVGDLIVDPFCGSGTIPLEAIRRRRAVIASDSNPYAVILTKAKLLAPDSLTEALDRLSEIESKALARPTPDLRTVPVWVRRFFHPRTLKDAIRFADECIAQNECFLFACLLGILHHQRPGFLSFPSSHLVPYLRTRKFPPEEYPELYGPREILTRLTAKVGRVYKRIQSTSSGKKPIIENCCVKSLSFPRNVAAIITSPPYMNALDYRRDNRLRLWFIDRTVSNYFPEPTDKHAEFIRMMQSLVVKAGTALKTGGHLILVVGETIRRNRKVGHPSSTVLELVSSHARTLRVIDIIEDVIPDIRRSRRDYRGTKTEHVLVFRKHA